MPSITANAESDDRANRAEPHPKRLSWPSVRIIEKTKASKKAVNWVFDRLGKVTPNIVFTCEQKYRYLSYVS